MTCVQCKQFFKWLAFWLEPILCSAKCHKEYFNNDEHQSNDSYSYRTRTMQ